MKISRIRLVILLTFLLGVACIAGSHFIPYEWAESVVKEFGVAFVIAAVLGVLVDETLKLGLVRDVFETTFGYLLPEQLRGELRWIYDQKLLCEHHSSHFTISRLDESSVILQESFDRKFKNVSDKTIPFTPSLAIDEWNHPQRKSRIVLLGYEVNGEPVEEKEGELAVQTLELGVISAIPKHKSIPLAKGQTIHVWGTIEEIPALNDHHVSVFQTPTCDPHVRVTADNTLEARVTFGHREKAFGKKIGPGAWQLEGLLLPNQSIRVQWREREAQ